MMESNVAKFPRNDGGDFLKHEPLYQLIRPKSLVHFIGQKHLINPKDGAIMNFIRLGYLPSMLLYGPPGVGKTTLASILAAESGYVFIELSATDSTIEDMKDLSKTIIQENKKRSAKEELLKVVVFIDEIHRFSKTQQDFLLPFIEEGSFVFIGATTVNPKKRIRRAILSRCQLFELYSINKAEIKQVLQRAIDFENKRREIKNLSGLFFDQNCVDLIANRSSDTRMGISLVEFISSMYKSPMKNTDGIAPSENTDEIRPQVELENIQEITSQITPESYDAKSIMDGADLIRVKDEVLIEAINSIWYVHSGMHDIKNKSRFLRLSDSMRHIHEGKMYFAISKNEGDQMVSGYRSVYKWKRKGMFLDDFKRRIIEDSNEYLRQMQVSDDSDLESERDEEEHDLDIESADPEEYFVVQSLIHLQKLLQAGESPVYIGKQLLLFVANYVEAEVNALKTVVAHLKALSNTSMDPSVVLSECVEWITRLEKKPYALTQQYKSYREYAESKSTTKKMNMVKLITEISYDPELISQLMHEPMEEDDEDQNPGFEIVPYDEQFHHIGNI